MFSDAEKRELAEKVSEAIIDVEGEGLREKTVVIVEETRSGDWAVGGSSLTTEVVRGLRRDD
ncbi:MAG: tautomerase family protein [Planctomycetota bacterium]